MRSLRFFPLLVVLLLDLPSLRAQNTEARAKDVYSLVADREALVSLEGLWRFHAGDDPEWAAPAFDDARWPLVRSDRPWTDQGFKEAGGFAWYRFVVRTPATPLHLALLLPSILTDYEVFANGRKVGGFGRMPPHGSLQFGQVTLYHLPQVPANSDVTIAIRVWHHPVFASYLGGGTRYGGSMIGDTSLVEEEFRLRMADRSTYAVDLFALAIVDALVGITVLGLFLSRRSEREYLWFAVVLLSGAVTSAMLIADFLLHFSMNWREFTAEALQSLSLIASLLFFSRVLRAKHTWLWRGTLVLVFLAPLWLFPQARGWLSVAAVTCLRVLSDVPLELCILVLLVRKARAGSRDARLLLLPTLLLYGNQVISGLWLCSYQLGWQRRVVGTSQWNLITRPYRIETYALVEFLFVAALLAFLIRRFAQSRASEQQHQADLEAARVLQRVLIPETRPVHPGVCVESAYFPAQEVGGDFFQIFSVPSRRPGEAPDTFVVLGDVAGKGLPAAMSVSFILGALRSSASLSRSPAELLEALNGQLTGQQSGFVTCLALRLSAAGELTVANAGHLAPYLNGKELALDPALPLGVDPNAVFDQRVLQLAEGDQLTLLTDGVPEATHQRELFGFERTEALSRSSAQAIAEAAKHFGQTDDITVVTLRMCET